MEFDTPTRTVLYTIEQAIKEYRRFCQFNISSQNADITVDQVLALKFIQENPHLTQSQIAELVFKDDASMTRMIDLMVKKGYLTRAIHAEDRRRFQLEITEKGKEALHTLTPTIQYNRTTALAGLTDSEILQLHTTLQKIIANCKK